MLYIFLLVYYVCVCAHYIDGIAFEWYTAPIIKYDAIGKELQSDYVTQVLYINLDTVSQMMWGNDATQQEKTRFAFIQVVHAIPQNSMNPHISVRVFAKDVDDETTPADLVVQRKHVLYKPALGGSDRVDRVVFGMQIPNAGFKMTLHKKVLVGTCVLTRYGFCKVLT